MAVRPLKKLDFAHTLTLTVETGETVTAGKTVIPGSADNTCKDPGAASDLVIGVALGTPGEVFTAGAKVQVVLFAPIVPMVVGTGGSTRGKKQVVVSDGITDAAANGGGTTAVECIGVAMQSGVAGDHIGVAALINSRVKS